MSACKIIEMPLDFRSVENSHFALGAVQDFVYQSQTQIAAELDGDGKLVKQFIYGSKSNSPDYMVYQGKEYRIISDQVGTPKLVVDSSTGKALEELEMDEFGLDSRIGGQSVLPFGFAGGIYDRDTGLVRFGAREYLPQTGRWVSKDPLGFGGGSTNLYNYVASDPINFIDPRGLQGSSLPGLPFEPPGGRVGPPDDQPPIEPTDYCTYAPALCPDVIPLFGTPQPTAPVPTDAICFIHPDQCAPNSIIIPQCTKGTGSE